MLSQHVGTTPDSKRHLRVARHLHHTLTCTHTTLGAMTSDGRAIHHILQCQRCSVSGQPHGSALRPLLFSQHCPTTNLSCSTHDKTPTQQESMPTAAILLPVDTCTTHTAHIDIHIHGPQKHEHWSIYIGRPARVRSAHHPCESVLLCVMSTGTAGHTWKQKWT